ELHLSLARLLERRGDAGDDPVARVATIATHYAAAGDQPSALRAAVRAAREAGRIHAYAEVADQTERALELWPRVADPERSAEIDHVELLALSARAHGLVGDGSRAEVLTERALAEVDQRLDSVRYSRLLAQLARVQWKLNRGREALECAQRALTLLPAGEHDADRAALQAWLARTRVLRGQYREAIRDGELALAAAREAGEPCVAGEVLNTIGMARIVLGDVTDGEAQLREAMRIAREQGDIDDLGTAYANLADLLSLAGRTDDALVVVREGLEQMPGWVTRLRGWLEMTLSMLAFEAGDWDTARSQTGPAPSTLAGVMLIFRHMRDAEIALGDGDEQAAAASLSAAEPLVRVTSEAQWQGQFGALMAEHLRRAGDLDGARSAVAQALDALELCTDDVMRIARVTAAGMAVEADRGVRARDLHDPEDERDALLRAQLHLGRLEAAAQEGGPVEQAFYQWGKAEEGRARGVNDPTAWERAADAWEQLGRPYPAAAARWRQAEALVEAGDREGAAEVAARALEVARRLGANWLAGELRALIARARLQVEGAAGEGTLDPGAADDAGEAPFGLTPRELQVLALLADGATNRQIGANLYMAEKTASVHVSRILAKLGVQTRTQAAAVSHRLHLH
ncbi:MAG TPA: LuxR C-terminal-related transcriptional regulator, partial [Solirubrobacteraceae bacterium]|nr:LuxR C-terminal-related transcriptional regulator [Solirubrobacteraceae bacterium]